MFHLFFNDPVNYQITNIYHLFFVFLGHFMDFLLTLETNYHFMAQIFLIVLVYNV